MPQNLGRSEALEKVNSTVTSLEPEECQPSEKPKELEKYVSTENPSPCSYNPPRVVLPGKRLNSQDLNSY